MMFKLFFNRITKICLFASLIFPIYSHAQRASYSYVDSVVAVVNNDIITRSELNKRMQHAQKNLKSSGRPIPEQNELQKQVLEHMIIEHAQLQMAKETGIQVDDATLDRVIAGIAEQNKKSLPDFKKQIEKDGNTFANWREHIRDEITIRRLREREVDNKIQVSDAEIENFLSNVKSAASQQQYNLGHILIAVPEDVSDEQKAVLRKRAEEAMDKIKSGEKFSKIVSTYSESEDKTNGGQMGWRSHEQLPDIFADAVANMGVNELALVQSPKGFHILKVMDKRGDVNLPKELSSSIQQTHARHILIKINQLVSAEEAKIRLSKLKQRIEHNEATFEELAKSNSNDLSASKGGDLGWIYPGDTVPEFERAMNALKIGEISDPVESPFGFHIIQVLERQTNAASKERLSAVAKQAIIARKSREATDEWLQQLRDSTYVEYRLEEAK